MKVLKALFEEPQSISQNPGTMSTQNGNALGATAPAAAHTLDFVDSDSGLLSRQSPFFESPSDQMNVSPVPDASTTARSIQSGLTTAPASPPSESATPDESEATAIAPYGTRSRQRIGGSRPNYAEDKDVDMEPDMNGIYTKAISAGKSGGAIDGSPSETPLDALTRRGFSAVNGIPRSATGNEQVPKDSIPGTSTFAANPITSTTSKKRKQPGAGATTTSVTSHTVPARPKGAAGTNPRLQPETNMMTFERCGGYLNADGQLKADDGTAISINGEACSPFQNIRLLIFMAA